MLRSYVSLFKTKEAPIMTKWAKDVNIEKPHPEYPRPQMTRNEWMNLNGVWEFQRSANLNEKPPFGKKLTENILVPFPVESALSGIMEQLDKFWYRRTFEIPSKWKGKKILIHFGAVDYEQTNRQTNCDTANLGKTARANAQTLKAIRFLEEQDALSTLPEVLQEAAAKRMQYPDLSLTALCGCFEPPVSKSGLSHRMKKLEALAETLRQNLEQEAKA